MGVKSKMDNMKIVAIVSVATCIILSSAFLVVVLNLQASMQQTNEKLDALSEDFTDLRNSTEDQMTQMNQKLEESKEIVANLTQKITSFEENYYFP